MAAPRQSLTLASDGAVSGAPGGGKAPAFVPTEAVVLKVIVSLTLGALSVYFLHTGRKHADAERLVWAAVLGMATFVVWAF